MQILLLLFNFFLVQTHDLHLSMCDLFYNQEASRIEIQQRLFFDDLEKSLRIELSDKNFDITKQEESYADSLFTVYLNEHINLSINDQNVELKLLDWEFSDDAIVFYLYQENIKNVHQLAFFSSILFEIFSDQKNIVSIQLPEKRKSKHFDIDSKPLIIENK